MNKKKKLKLKKIKLHPATMYVLLILLTIILSGILSVFDFKTTYSTINQTDLSLEQNTVEVVNLFNYDGIKYIVSNAARNFISFAPLNMFILMAIGMSIAISSGFLDTLSNRVFRKIDNNKITFLIIFIATISTIINDIGYLILIPLAASIYKSKGRNPIAGVVAAYCGVAFGTGTTIFIGSTEVALIPYTTSAARLVDPIFHVSLKSNLYIMIVSTIILSIIGTIIMEKIIIHKIGNMKEKKNLEAINELEIIDASDNEQDRLSKDYLEKRGMRYATIVFSIVLFVFIYSLLPNLPLSGMLLDMNEKIYLNQLFGANSYFQDGFTYLTAFLFFVTGLAYGIGSKKFKNDNDVFEGCHENLSSIGGIILLIFLASQLIAIFKKTNLGTILTGIIANVIDSISFSGVPLLLIAIILITISNLFITTAQGKWIILAPVIVPPLMQSNISPQFLQFVLRASDSMTKGITPLSAFFVIFIAYLNIYNNDKSNPITIFQAIKMITPYFLIISITWLLLLIGWYIIGLPIGPGVYPTV